MKREIDAFPEWEIFILAGGLSSRMGRDKSRVRVGKRTMLGQVRETAGRLGFRVRVVRRDAVARCGPLGGILTALKRSRAERILLLACDMPLVSENLLRSMVKKFDTSPALFAEEGGRAGFPCWLRREFCLPVVAEQIERREFSLQALAKRLGAGRWRPTRAMAHELTNINTPEDLERVMAAEREKLVKEK